MAIVTCLKILYHTIKQCLLQIGQHYYSLISGTPSMSFDSMNSLPGNNMTDMVVESAAERSVDKARRNVHEVEARNREIHRLLIQEAYTAAVLREQLEQKERCLNALKYLLTCTICHDSVKQPTM
ncbi:hypothetical protein JR316_0011643 [Psilocybe cubensis]|uniref:Uncharacterized protein n=2 Tax=Psilocybe cubensis TaxID=181762 RepID=A0ACB8GK55_PSICU|nr:hypothetical protein JR316_0012542 [Psilocybe cubensis]XP_047743698.1 hypothetical protein JR316_0011643 [Psilocybe cubensis]KAH9475431.1 hypothetical protein JR316_0012542 [Psilocybe cubensis]KAH9476073.1 hypothetical protein JR316_0011643 [Psilocybe cubensis]